MNNYRPLLAFGIVLLVVIGGFWGVLTLASTYNDRLASQPASPSKVAEEPNQTPPATRQENSPKEEPKPEPQPAKNDSPKPQETPASQPSPTPSTPSAGTSPAKVPKAGMDEINVLLTTVGICCTIVLVARLRRQMIQLRLNR